MAKLWKLYINFLSSVENILSNFSFRHVVCIRLALLGAKTVHYYQTSRMVWNYMSKILCKAKVIPSCNKMQLERDASHFCNHVVYEVCLEINIFFVLYRIWNSLFFCLIHFSVREIWCHVYRETVLVVLAPYVEINSDTFVYIHWRTVTALRSQITINPFPPGDAFWRNSSRRLLKTLWPKVKLLMISNFSFGHNVFNFI